MNPYAKIDELERVVRQQTMQITALATAIASLSAQHAALCTALGQDVLPGEHPLAEGKAERKGRH